MPEPTPIPLVITDAFADEPFEGNPAAIAVLPPTAPPATWPVAEVWMQAVAAEMNLSETAFLVPRDHHRWGLRWFTPTVEVDLCGHATLASAHVLADTGVLALGDVATFETRSGDLTATIADDGWIDLDLPVDRPEPVAPPTGLLETLGLGQADVLATARGRFDLLVVTDAATVRTLDPDLRGLRRIDTRAVIVAALGDDGRHDVVSRVFAPASGIDEDPVTGSAHCTLGAWFGPALGGRFLARQVSSRGGTVRVEVRGDRVGVAGRAVTVLRGQIDHPA